MNMDIIVIVLFSLFHYTFQLTEKMSSEGIFILLTIKLVEMSTRQSNCDVIEPLR